MTLSEFANDHRLQVKRDPQDNTDIIPGKDGHIFEYDDGVLGVVVMPETGTAYHWNAATKAFLATGMTVTQDGDDEGIATFCPENGQAVKAAVKYAGIKRRRQITDTQRQRLSTHAFKALPERSGQPCTGPIIPRRRATSCPRIDNRDLGCP